ncbi:MAG: putative repeat protein (TIGR01451 family), partial [Pseudoalteromonas distincta]
VDGTYSLSLNGTSSWSQTSPTSPSSISLTINQVTQSTYSGNDFGNSANCSSPDFTVALGNTAMRRGLLSDLNVKITNEGAYPASSSVSVKLTMSDDMYLTATNYTSISTANNLRTYVFSLGTISALSDSILTLTDSIDVNATLNDTIEVSATVIYSGSECDTLNNTASFSDIIVGSIDPNDKQVFVSDNNTKHKTKDTYPELLTYKIRFQNLGNYAARRVQLVDTLSPLLDWSTFSVSGSSHDFSVSIIDGVATWINENIELPCTEDNEEESNGFIAFTVATKANAAPYTLVHNVAYIQFDRNPYIATNDASAVIGLGNLIIDKTELIVYPNPVQESTSILLIDENQRPVEISSIDVLSLAGEIQTKISPSSYKTILYITDLASGMYTLRITTHDGKAYYKKIVKI